MPRLNTPIKGFFNTLINFLSGVLQGCPASAFLFNNTLDPFSTRFHNTLRSKKVGIVRACADDIGISLIRLKHLTLVAPVFKECKTFAGLELKPSKCVLVPLCMFSPKVHDEVKKSPIIGRIQSCSSRQIARILHWAPGWNQDVGGTHEKIQWKNPGHKKRTRIYSFEHSYL